MKTTGLIFTWFAMTVILVFGHENIEEMQSFLAIYVLLIIYLVCIIGLYIKRRKSSKTD